MEDDGPASARSWNGGAAKARHVRAARLGRMGLGVGQVVPVAHLHHLHPRLPARPRVLPDGQQHGRPRRPRLVADQPLPADQRDAAVPRAAGRRHPVESVTDRARAPGGADGRLGAPGRDADPVHRWDRWEDGPVIGLRRADGRHRELRQVAAGPDAPRRSRRCQRGVRVGQHLRHRWHRRLRQDDRHRVRPQPRQPDRPARRLDEGGRSQAPRRSRRRGHRDHDRRTRHRRGSE